MEGMKDVILKIKNEWKGNVKVMKNEESRMKYELWIRYEDVKFESGWYDIYEMSLLP